MIFRYYITGLLGVFCFLVKPYTTYAQKDTIQREVQVIKAYIPTVPDAEKINDMPVIKDEVHKKPDFSYSIDDKPVFSTLSVKDLQAATIVGKPAEKPGYGLIRAGAGNYNRPYGEIFFNNPKGKNFIFGLHGRHLSSFGKLNLKGGDRVKAPFSENEAEMFLKYMVGKSTLSVNLGIDHDGFRYYGYPGTDTIPNFLKPSVTSSLSRPTYQDTRQAFTRGGISIDLKNIYASKSDPSLGFNFQYYRFGTKTGQREDYMKFEMNLKRPRDLFSFVVDAGVEYSNVTNIYASIFELLPVNTHRGQTWLFFKPAIYIGNETVNLKAGIKTWVVAGLVDKLQFKIAPNVRFNFAPVKEIINVFAGADGDYHHNHYSAIAYENPFVIPTLTVNNHHEKYRIYGGFDGKISSKTNFKLQVDHSAFNNHPFYYLQGFRLAVTGTKPPPAYIDNTFRVLYDDMKTLKFNGEITHNVGSKFNLLLSANIYKYTMTNQEKPWNLPKFDANLSVSYAVNERFTVATDFYVIGKRDGLVMQTNSLWNPSITWERIQLLSSISSTTPFPGNTYVMDMALDMNVRGNYDISRKFAVFAQLNNFGFQKYEKWLGYPVQSFNFLGGISYSF
jgi:hypothetical protein